MYNKKNKKQKDTRQSFDIKKSMQKVATGIQGGKFVFTGPLSIGDFAAKLNKSSNEILKYFFMKGKMLSINSVLDEEDIGEICLEFNLDFEKKLQLDETNILENLNVIDDEKSKVRRCPVVTIMGHVDHGKTTLLDYIRKTKIVANEFGGITQHIGAYQVVHKNNPITFIDTPGHEAFTQMRARGASLTDIIVLVVAGDDGIKPQTEEAIDHAKAAGVPIVVFTNKMDKPGINVEKTLSALAEKELTAEEWGGDTIVIKGSALTGMGVSDLLDYLSTVAEMLELKANPNRDGMGITIEANMDKGFGPVATLLVQNGTVEKGDFIVIGKAYGRIRAMFDDVNKELTKAVPGQPIKVIGLSEVPLAGSKWLVMKDEDLAKDLSRKIKDNLINIFRSKNNSVDENNTNKKLNTLLKADVHGSLEAIKSMLDQVKIEGVEINLIRSAIGGITESDIQLAKASDGIIVGFNVKPTKPIKDLASEQSVNIYFYNIIYKLKEDIIDKLYGRLDPVSTEQDLGEATVKQTWTHSSIGTIAGCLVSSGKILRNAKARILRDGVVIYNGSIGSLQQQKNLVNEVTSGKECGIVITNFSNLKENDVIQAYKIVEKTAKEVANEK